MKDFFEWLFTRRKRENVIRIILEMFLHLWMNVFNHLPLTEVKKFSMVQRSFYDFLFKPDYWYYRLIYLYGEDINGVFKLKPADLSYLDWCQFLEEVGIELYRRGFGIDYLAWKEFSKRTVPFYIEKLHLTPAEEFIYYMGQCRYLKGIEECRDIMAVLFNCLFQNDYLHFEELFQRSCPPIEEIDHRDIAGMIIPALQKKDSRYASLILEKFPLTMSIIGEIKTMSSVPPETLPILKKVLAADEKVIRNTEDLKKFQETADISLVNENNRATLAAYQYYSRNDLSLYQAEEFIAFVIELESYDAKKAAEFFSQHQDEARDTSSLRPCQWQTLYSQIKDLAKLQTSHKIRCYLNSQLIGRCSCDELPDSDSLVDLFDDTSMISVYPSYQKDGSLTHGFNYLDDITTDTVVVLSSLRFSDEMTASFMVEVDKLDLGVLPSWLSINGDTIEIQLNTKGSNWPLVKYLTEKRIFRYLA